MKTLTTEEDARALPHPIKMQDVLQLNKTIKRLTRYLLVDDCGHCGQEWN